MSEAAPEIKKERKPEDKKKSRPRVIPKVRFQPLNRHPALEKIAADLRFQSKVEDAKRRAEEIKETLNRPALDLKAKFSGRILRQMDGKR
jgi:hypothetical protein